MSDLQRTLDATTSGTFDLKGLNAESPHTQIAMRFIDSQGEDATPGAGTFSVSVRPDGSNFFQPIQLGTDITATGALDVLTYSAIGDQIKYEPTGITIADRIVFTVRSTAA